MKALLAEKKTALDEIKKASASNFQSMPPVKRTLPSHNQVSEMQSPGEQSYRANAQDSGRGTKSLSPLRVAAVASSNTMKGSGVVSVQTTPSLGMEDLRSKFN